MEISISNLDLAWLAGLLEGEGSFLFASPSSYSAAVGVSLQMSDEDVVARASALMGAAYRRWVSPRNPAWKPVFITNVRGRRAVCVMEMVLPFMGKRRSERIHLVLASIEHKPRHKPEYVLTEDMMVYTTEQSSLGRSARSIGRDLGKHHSVVCDFLRRNLEIVHGGPAS